jgi:hypothetical protein
MGNQGSAERSREGGKEGKEKKKGFLNCQCGKGRDDKDEVNGPGRARAGTKLTEEEWAQVKTGRLHVDRGQPDLVLEEAGHSKVPPRSKLYKEGGDATVEARSNGTSAAKHEPKNPYRSSARTADKAQVKPPERFKVNDRVKCACKKWCAFMPHICVLCFNSSCGLDTRREWMWSCGRGILEGMMRTREIGMLMSRCAISIPSMLQTPRTYMQVL